MVEGWNKMPKKMEKLTNKKPREAHYNQKTIGGKV